MQDGPKHPTTRTRRVWTAAGEHRVLLKGGGGGSKGGGWVGLWGATPPPAGDPQLLEARKARKKFFDLN